MKEILSENIYLIILLPFWIFLVIMLGRFFSVYVNKRIIHLLTLFSSASGACLCALLYLLYSKDTVYESVSPFIQIKDFIIPFGIYIDKVSLIFTTILFAVSFFVQLFSISNMKNDKKQYRFFALLNLFNFSTAGLFFSPNLYQTYLFWEITGLVSYLLIGFEYLNPIKSLASKKVFIINRVGDTAFLGGIIMCSYLLYEYAPAKSLTALPFYDINTVTLLTGVYSSKPLFLIICGLFIIAAAVKSAQFLFHTWLQDAMEAKLPVSALLHSATLVALGGYLIIRLIPLFMFSDAVLKIIILIGALTAFLCALFACVQDNPKRVLAYSTSAQMGLIFLALGILNVKAALCLFCAHAFTKSMLFILLPEESKKWGLADLILFILGGLSLTGLILSGMPAKEILAENLGDKILLIISTVSFLTGFYITRLAAILYKKHRVKGFTSNKAVFLSSLGLLLSNILLCIYLHKFSSFNIGIPYLTALAGVFVSSIIYLNNLNRKIPILYPLLYEGFYIDKFYTKILAKFYGMFSFMLAKTDENLSENYFGIKKAAALGVRVFNLIEEKIMNKSVVLTAKLFKRASVTDSKFQNGNIQNYNLYAFIIMTTITVCLVAAYITIAINFEGVG